MEFTISKKIKKILLNIARISIVNFLNGINKTTFDFENDAILEKRAVFVTLWERDSGNLRGCIGNINAIYPLVEAISKTAVSASFEDPRFSPLTKKELKNIKIEINVLYNFKEIRTDEIEIGKHGLYLIQESFSSVFLPEVAISQGWNVNIFLDELSLKAGLNRGDWKKPETKILGFESASWIEN